MNIHVREIGSAQTTRLTADTIRDITMYQWKGDRRLVVSSDLAENKFIFRVFGDRSSDAYYLYDVEADRITKLAECRGSIPATLPR